MVPVKHGIHIMLDVHLLCTEALQALVFDSMTSRRLLPLDSGLPWSVC